MKNALVVVGIHYVLIKSFRMLSLVAFESIKVLFSTIYVITVIFGAQATKFDISDFSQISEYKMTWCTGKQITSTLTKELYLWASSFLQNYFERNISKQFNSMCYRADAKKLHESFTCVFSRNVVTQAMGGSR